MLRKLTHAALAAGLIIFSWTPGHADDAEIYIGDLPPTAGLPAVMFTLDLRSNLNASVCTDWAQCFPLFERADMLDEVGSTDETDPPDSVTFFQLLRAALKVVLAPVENVYVGLMLNHENINNCEGEEKESCSNGGYVAMDFRLATVDTTEGGNDPVKDAFDGLLKSIPPPQDKDFGNYSHSYQGRELFFEFWRYLKGNPVYNGWNGFTSYDGNLKDASKSINIAEEDPHSKRWITVAKELSDDAAEHLLEMEGFAPDPGALSTAIGDTPRIYRNADYLGECAQIYTVNFLFQVSQQENDSDAAIGADIPVLSSKGGFDEIIEYMNRTDLALEVPGDQKVISYFFGDSKFTGGDGRKLDGYAQAGGTGFARELSEDPDKLVADLQNVFDQILSVSTTFTAAALPINSFDRAQLREDVFLALFQPKGVAPFPAGPGYWWGNVKKLRLPQLNSAADNVELVDANGDPAIAADGRIERNRLTFWTNPDAEDVQTPERDPDKLAQAGFDGRSVNRGGAGHRIPTFPDADSGPRTLYYDTKVGETETLTPLAANDTVASALAPEFETDEATALQLIHYLRGEKNPDDSTKPLDWLMGSAIHSRPLPINYGAVGDHDQDNPLVYIAVGTNDGLFRFIRNTMPGDATTSDLSIHVGKEVWAFAPRSTMEHAKRIFSPTDENAPGTIGETTVYGVDSPPVSWLEDKNGDGTIDASEGDRALVFFGLRRGGRAYYALDVSRPEAPTLHWKIDAEEDSDFTELGLTFSEPSVGRLDYDNDGEPEIVLVFGGGYDRRYDDESWVPTDPQGAAIYIVDAEDGALVRKFSHPDMLDSIASAPTVVDTDGDDRLDRIYVGDLGGKIWRVDMFGLTEGTADTTATTKDEWPISLFANVGRHAAGTAPGSVHDRRFFHKPDVVQAGKFRDASGRVIAPEFDAVITASGDRASPLETNVQNWAFMLRDSNIGILDAAEDTNVQVADLYDVTGILAAPVDNTYKGWRLELAAIGEKGLSTPLTIGNVVFFTTYVPPGATATDAVVCGPAEGSGRLYRLSLFNANPLRDGPIDPWDKSTSPAPDWFTPLRSGGIPAEVVALPPNRILRPDLDVEPVPVTARWRTFWHLDDEPVE